MRTPSPSSRSDSCDGCAGPRPATPNVGPAPPARPPDRQRRGRRAAGNRLAAPPTPEGLRRSRAPRRRCPAPRRSRRRLTSMGAIQRTVSWSTPHERRSRPRSAQRWMTRSVRSPSGARVARSVTSDRADHRGQGRGRRRCQDRDRQIAPSPAVSWAPRAAALATSASVVDRLEDRDTWPRTRPGCHRTSCRARSCPSAPAARGG